MLVKCLAAALLSSSLLSVSWTAFAFTLANPKRTQGLASNPAQTNIELVRITGPGKFLSAQVSKQGGSNDLTFVNLTVDGQNVVSISYAAAKNIGYGADNLFGLKLLETPSGIKNLTIGFPGLLEFKQELVLGITVRETAIAQILGNVISGQ